MPNYPAGLPALVTTRVTGNVIPATDHNDTASEVNAIATELGTNPKGSAASVRARMESLESGQTSEASTRASADTALSNRVTPLEARSLSGTGSPEGVISASPGATYQQTNGADGKVLWVKRTGTGNTGWRVKRSVIPYDMILFGPESRAAEGLEAAVSTTYANQGSAFSASTAYMLQGLDARITLAFFSVIWTPRAVGCGVRLVTMDAGPSNITQLVEVPGSANAAPVNDGAYVAAATLQTEFDLARDGTLKSLGYQTKGNGTVGPLIYAIRLQVLLEV